MKNRARWLTIFLTFVLASLSSANVFETYAAGPYEYLILNQSEAGALNLDTIQLTDNSVGDTIDVRGEYTAVPISDPSRPITLTVAVSHLSPTDDISYDTALANCVLCANPGWGNCRIWGIGFEKPCYNRFEDGHINFGAYGIDRNRCWFGGTSVFSVNGLKIIITSEKLDYGLTQVVWDEVKRKHDEFVDMIALKVRTTYDPQTMSRTLVPLSSTYSPGEPVVISGSVADTFDSTPIAGASITVDVSGTPLNTATNASGDFSVQFDIPNAVSSVGTYPITVAASYSGYPDITEETYLTVAEEFLETTVQTDKAAYAPGDTVLIRGLVSKGGIGVSGAVVEVNVSGSIVSATSDGSGNYQVDFMIPADTVQLTFNVTVTATDQATGSATANTTFTIALSLSVTITSDKDHYLIGDTVYCTINVDESPNKPVSYADLAIKTTYLATGRTTDFTGSSDAQGENVWTFIWGEDVGNPVSEGKLKIDVSASKTGYSEGSASITLAGCGDLVHSDSEDCFDCEEDCACGPDEQCDPSSDYKNSSTMCSPKIAYVFISEGLGWYHQWWSADDIKGIRKKYKKLGYNVPSSIYVNHIDQIAKYLSRPSTKALAYAGHGEEPGGIPTIELAGATASSGIVSIKEHIDATSKRVGGFLYRCQYESYAAKWVENRDKIEDIANNRKEHPDLENVYMFSCYSLDDDSLMNYLVESGGTYWGYPGKLPGHATLIERTK